MAKTDAIDTSTLVEELEAIKRLLVLALLRDGATQTEIANALHVNQSWVSKNYPKPSSRKVKSSKQDK